MSDRRSTYRRVIPSMSASDELRFDSWVAVEPNTGCHLWLGAPDRKGYGRFHIARKVVFAHRANYVRHVGPIPDGLDLDHLCRTPACVNPEHLEPVSNDENIRRGEWRARASAQRRSRTHCPQGHPYSGDNLYIKPNGARDCKTCLRRRRRH